jgi:hypothetical protein
MAREMLRGLFEADGTADVSEIKTRVGAENMGSINYRLSNVLVPEGLVDVMKPETDGGGPPARVLSLTGVGENVAETIREVNAGDSDGEGVLPLDERLDRLEAALDSEYGMWGVEEQEQFEVTVDLMRVMRDFLLAKHGDEFKNYVDENFGS